MPPPDVNAQLLQSLAQFAGAVSLRLGLRDFRVLEIDERVGTAVGIAPAVWLRPDFWDTHLHPDDQAAFATLQTRAQLDGPVLDARVRLTIGSAEYLSVRLICQSGAGASDELAGFVIPDSPVVPPLSPRYHADRLEAITTLGNVMMSEFDIAHRVEIADPRLATRLGYGPGELVTRDEWLSIVDERDRDAVTRHEAECLSIGAGESVTTIAAIDYRVRRSDGSIVWLRRETSVWRNRSGVPERVVSAIRDVTREIESRVGMAEATAITEAILAAIPGFAALLDGNGVVLAVNDEWRAAADGRGRYADSFPGVGVGKSYVDVLLDAIARGIDDAAPVVDALNRVLNGEALHASVDYGWADKSHPLRWTMIARQLKNRSGVLIVHSLPRDGPRGSALSELGESAERVGQLAVAGELLGAVTHDLRQPLTALRMNLSAALSLSKSGKGEASGLDEILSDALVQQDRIQQSLTIIQDLVARHTPIAEPVNLSQIAGEVVRIVETESIVRKIPLHARLGAGLPLVQGDRRLIREAMLSLILDAFRGQGDRPAASRVTITTKQSGDRHVDLIVCRFTEDDEGTSGWVLAVARPVAEVHSVPLVVDDDAVSGSCVRLRWPVYVPEDAGRSVGPETVVSANTEEVRTGEDSH
jgi:PAS domain S-box-containing protein